jgi:hypothetical protein
MADKFPAEPGSIFTGNAMLPTTPSGRWSFTGQEIRANAEGNEMKTEATLVEIAAHDAFAYILAM